MKNFFCLTGPSQNKAFKVSGAQLQMNVASSGVNWDGSNGGQQEHYVRKCGPWYLPACQTHWCNAAICPAEKIVKVGSSVNVDPLLAHSSVDQTKGSSVPRCRQPWSSARSSRISCQLFLSLLGTTSSSIPSSGSLDYTIMITDKKYSDLPWNKLTAWDMFCSHWS